MPMEWRKRGRRRERGSGIGERKGERGIDRVGRVDIGQDSTTDIVRDVIPFVE